ncbi:MAG: alcohol dehydrogenase catalytic domain-containing protein [Cohaesibacteraceae bacterium]
MSQGRSLSCQNPETSALKVIVFERTQPKTGDIEIAVEAASVNPIDVQRATGYGRKLLSLLGAGTFPMTLGNDFSGVITAVGSEVTGFSVGDRVFGAKKPSRFGTHASHVHVKATPELVALVPSGHELTSVAALPYSFTTMWLAVRDAGRNKHNASGKKVLVHGAAGGLGSLALQMLSDWGADITAIAFPKDHQACLDLGATSAIGLSSTPFGALAGAFDATLNFATWDHDQQLLGCVTSNALGHATTGHPMLRTFDESGLIGGAAKTFLGKRNSRRALPPGVNRYSWTIFQPKADALAELVRLLEQGRAMLYIGLDAPLAEGAEAFAHVKDGQPGRALIAPQK